MSKTKLLCCLITILFVAFVSSSVSFGAENSSQSEIDDLISRVEKGDPEAQFQLGEMYYKGKNVKQNYEQAFYWFDKSAKQNNDNAQFRLFIMYFNGENVKKDDKKAFYWLKKSHDKRSTTRRTFFLAVAYYEGVGTEKDYKRACELFKEIADIERFSAAELFSDVEVTKFRAISQCELGKLYMNGQGITQDYGKAEFYLRKAVENGDDDIKANANDALKRLQVQTSQKPEHSSSQARVPPAKNVVALSNPRNFDEAKGNAVIFLNSIEEVAEKLIATDTYNTQDIEVMPADEYREESETVYMRAWYNEKYFMFSNYANSPRPVACFRTYSPEFTFAGGIKVGSSFSDIRYLFGDFGSWNAEQNTLYVNEGSTEVNIHFDSGRINYIEYEYMGAEYTHTMMNLLYLYRDDIRAASVTTDSRLNVCDANGTHGNILFQVTKQNNILFVDTSSPTDGNGNRWRRVRFVYDKSTNTISSVNEGYVMGKYINVEPLGYGDRQSLITVFSK